MADETMEICDPSHWTYDEKGPLMPTQMVCTACVEKDMAALLRRLEAAEEVAGALKAVQAKAAEMQSENAECLESMELPVDFRDACAWHRADSAAIVEMCGAALQRWREGT